jgi:hypothetical protein
MSMPPFLKKLGFNKQKKDSEEEEISPTVTTIVEEPEGEQVMAVEEDMEEVKELSETEKLMKKVKASGTAGIVSYALWELAFWALSVPVCVFGYREVTGYVSHIHTPILSDLFVICVVPCIIKPSRPLV